MERTGHDGALAAVGGGATRDDGFAAAGLNLCGCRRVSDGAAGDGQGVDGAALGAFASAVVAGGGGGVGVAG